MQSGEGTIKSISRNTITVQNKKSELVELRVGACSRIEATKILPEVGQTIFYKGIATQGATNLYTASCF